MIKLHKQSVKPNNPIIPKVYGLPKTYKPGKKMRPIVSNIGAPTDNLAKWLVKRFETFPKFLTLNIISLEKWLTSLTFSKFETSEYEQLTKLCIFHNAFKFVENFYIQNNGLTMGNPLSPFLANLFMSELEIYITSSFPWMCKVGTDMSIFFTSSK